MKIIALTAMALGLAAVQSTCPGVTLTGKLPSSIRPGTTTYYQLKIKNTGATTLTGLSLVAQLPCSTEFMSLKALPALVGPASPLVDGQLLTWTGLSIAPRRTQTLKLAVAISSCASNTVAFNANITGPNDCVTMAPPSQTTLKRSAKDNPCAPTPAPTARVPLTCETPVGTTSGGETIYECAPQYLTDWGGIPSSTAVASLSACADHCLANNKRAFTYYYMGAANNCLCYTPTVTNPPNNGSWVVYCQDTTGGTQAMKTYYTGSVQNPPLETTWYTCASGANY